MSVRLKQVLSFVLVLSLLSALLPVIGIAENNIMETSAGESVASAGEFSEKVD